jgi:ABC-type polysaccharide/polyol phosphate export permease
LATNASGAKREPGAIFGSFGVLYERRWLVWYFIQRQLTQSHRGSFLGLFWLVLGPLMMASLYTLVFSEVVGLRFRETDSASNFGLYMFCGLLPFLALSTTLNRSSSSIKGNSTLVKRVVFPLEVIPFSTAATSIIAQFFGFTALLFLIMLFEGHLQWTLLYLPIIIIPQLFLTLGAGYLTTIAGAYLPDLKESMQAITRAMFFTTPIIWPVERVPDHLSFIVDYNPLAYLVEVYRNLFLDGVVPDMRGLFFFTLFSLALAVLGFILFARTKKKFADLI